MANEINTGGNPNTQRVIDMANDATTQGSNFAAEAHSGMEKMLSGGLKLAGALAGMLGGVLGSCGGGCGGM